MIHSSKVTAGYPEWTRKDDRDSEIVAFDFDERDAGVKELIRLAVAGAHRHGRHVGICGQAPSDYPEMLDFLVSIGIDSISLNPDSVLGAVKRIAAAETSILVLRAPAVTGSAP